MPSSLEKEAISREKSDEGGMHGNGRITMHPSLETASYAERATIKKNHSWRKRQGWRLKYIN